MNVKLPLVTAVSVALLSACVPMQPMTFPAPSADPLQIVDGEYETRVTVNGPQSVHGNFYGAPEFSTRLISSFDKKTRQVVHGIAFVNRYSGRGWRFWSYASTSHAKDLDVAVGSRDVGSCGSRSGCSHTEQILIVLPDDVLSTASQEGIKVRVQNKIGWDWFVEYSGGEIQYQLRSLKEATAKYR